MSHPVTKLVSLVKVVSVVGRVSCTKPAETASVSATSGISLNTSMLRPAQILWFPRFSVTFAHLMLGNFDARLFLISACNWMLAPSHTDALTRAPPPLECSPYSISFLLFSEAVLGVHCQVVNRVRPPKSVRISVAFLSAFCVHSVCQTGQVNRACKCIESSNLFFVSVMSFGRAKRKFENTNGCAFDDRMLWSTLVAKKAPGKLCLISNSTIRDCTTCRSLRVRYACRVKETERHNKWMSKLEPRWLKD